jgi:hypothetical protein
MTVDTDLGPTTCSDHTATKLNDSREVVQLSATREVQMQNFPGHLRFERMQSAESSVIL